MTSPSIEPTSAPARFTFRVGDLPASALVYRASRASHVSQAAQPSVGTRSALLVLAHGAGAPQTHPWLVAMASLLAARGLDVVTFNFPYSEAGRRLPDKGPVLEAAWHAVLAAVRARPEFAASRLFIGGKSMGGRFATMVAAAGAAGDVAGLVLLGYPLHPPGNPAKLRAAHLPAVVPPMLFVQGSRDAFGTPDELGPIVAPLAPRGTRLFVVEGGDHSFAVPRKSGDRDAVLGRVADAIAHFTA